MRMNVPTLRNIIAVMKIIAMIYLSGITHKRDSIDCTEGMKMPIVGKGFKMAKLTNGIESVDNAITQLKHFNAKAEWIPTYVESLNKMIKHASSKDEQTQLIIIHDAFVLAAPAFAKLAEIAKLSVVASISTAAKSAK